MGTGTVPRNVRPSEISLCPLQVPGLQARYQASRDLVLRSGFRGDEGRLHTWGSHVPAFRRVVAIAG
jgi:hypothetical protein